MIMWAISLVAIIIGSVYDIAEQDHWFHRHHAYSYVNPPSYLAGEMEENLYVRDVMSRYSTTDKRRPIALDLVSVTILVYGIFSIPMGYYFLTKLEKPQKPMIVLMVINMVSVCVLGVWWLNIIIMR